MKNLQAAQTELTKNLSRVEANEVPELLELVNDIRLESSLLDYSQDLLYLLMLIHEAQNEGVCVANFTVRNFLTKQHELIRLLK